jgi:hypothetical protein
MKELIHGHPDRIWTALGMCLHVFIALVLELCHHHVFSHAKYSPLALPELFREYLLPHVAYLIGHMPLQQLMLVTSAIYFNTQEQGFSLCSTLQRPLHRYREREGKMT